MDANIDSLLLPIASLAATKLEEKEHHEYDLASPATQHPRTRCVEMRANGALLNRLVWAFLGTGEGVRVLL